MASSTQIVPSSSLFPSSPNSPLPSSYDAFISFCGEDTRNGFVDHLYADFQRKGLIVFKDDKKLERGNSIHGELSKAIKQSQYAVVVISEKFAFSKWCLIELKEIVECETEKRLKILPIFYHIDPSEVRKQMKIFGRAFAKYREDPDVSETQKAWSAALRKVGNIAGWHVLPTSAEAAIVNDITGKILRGVRVNSSKSFEGLVGIRSRVKEVEKKLCLGRDDVRVIGIHGMAGIGKTTLAKALFRKVRYEFDSSCFICCDNKRIWELYQQIVHQILGEKELKIWDPICGTDLLETRLCNKKVFIILDDVDREQLQELVKDAHWFGQGSRIVVTGKDRQLLMPQVDETYEVKPLHYEDALELFFQKAFKNSCPKPSYLKLVENIMRQVNGHPLAIIVIGSSLYGKGEEVWIGVHDVLEADSNGDILKKLKISYEMLGDSLKKYFLDIACFGEWFVNILKLFDQSSSLHIEALEDRSLINTRFGQVVMHNLLRKLGQQVVYQMSPLEPGNRSRLWVNQDIVQVLRNDSGSKAIEGIVTENSHDDDDSILEVNFESFFKMTRLTVLIINYFEFRNFKWIGNSSKLVLSKELRVIRWEGFPLKSLPHNFQPNNLVELSLQNSKIEVLCFGNKSFGQLKRLDLSFSECLMEISDWSGVPNLENLVLRCCKLLQKIHSSITNLDKLVYLCLDGCGWLRDDVTSSLRLVSRNSGIEIDRPYSLKEIGSQPQRIRKLSRLTALTSLTSLDLSCCNLSDGDIPKDIRFLSLLKFLYLTANKFTRIPEGLTQLSNLKWLRMNQCWHLQSLSTSPPSRLSFLSYPLSNLETLATRKCHFLESSSTSLFSNLSSLSYPSLDLPGSKFTTLHVNFFLLSNLEWLDLDRCSELRTLPKFSLSLRRLDVEISPLSKMDYYQMDVRNIPLCISVWFSVATKAGCNSTPYKILQLNPRHVSGEVEIYGFDHGDIFAWGPTLRYEIPSWFNNRSINHFPKIQCHVDVDSKYKKMGLALFVAYQVHEHEDSNCCISGGTLPEFPEFVWRFQASGICKELPLVFHVPEVPLVGPNGFWAYIPIELFKRNGMNLDSCHYFKTSIETSNLKVEVKECGIRPVFRHDISEFFDILNSITPRGLELKKREDFDFEVKAGLYKTESEHTNGSAEELEYETESERTNGSAEEVEYETESECIDFDDDTESSE